MPGAAASVKAATWCDGGVSVRPPAGYHLVGQEMTGQQFTRYIGTGYPPKDTTPALGGTYAATKEAPKTVHFEQPLQLRPSRVNKPTPRNSVGPPVVPERVEMLSSREGSSGTTGRTPIDSMERMETEPETADNRVSQELGDPTSITAEQFERWLLALMPQMKKLFT
ncbi:hypothetical protein ACHAQJ_009744 [Trichoderma viride]